VRRTQHPAPESESALYGQVAATIFTDATSSVRMLLALLAAPAALVGGLVVAPGVAPGVALVAAAALPVTATRWPT
jgi:hypothetical protein